MYHYFVARCSANIRQHKNKTTMSIRVYLLLLLVVVSTMAQTFQYSRGWTNGKKRADPTLIQQQSTHGRLVPIDSSSNTADDWSRFRVNEEPMNEDGDRLGYVNNHCAKLATLLGSYLTKTNEKASDEPIINIH